MICGEVGRKERRGGVRERREEGGREGGRERGMVSKKDEDREWYGQI